MIKLFGFGFFLKERRESTQLKMQKIKRVKCTLIWWIVFPLLCYFPMNTLTTCLSSLELLSFLAMFKFLGHIMKLFQQPSVGEDTKTGKHLGRFLCQKCKGLKNYFTFKKYIGCAVFALDEYLQKNSKRVIRFGTHQKDQMQARTFQKHG